MTPTLSIVILVYKTAHLLRRCLDSLVTQTSYYPQKVQLVVVSDASPDNADEVMAAYMLNHPGITYCRRPKNGGEAAARNTGLEACTGEYYTYVDSDDEVTGDYLMRIMRIISQYHPDVLTYRYRTCDENGADIGTIGLRPEGFYEAQTSVKARRQSFSTFSMSLRCNSVIRREVVSGVRYQEQYKLGIDGLFNFEAYLRSKTFYISNAVIYRYYQYASSATHNFSERQIDDLLKIHQYYMKRIKEQPYFADVRDLARGFFYSNYITWIANEIARFGCHTDVGKHFFENFKCLYPCRCNWHRMILGMLGVRGIRLLRFTYLFNMYLHAGGRRIYAYVFR